MADRYIFHSLVTASLIAVVSAPSLAEEPRPGIEIVSAEFAAKDGSGSLDVRQTLQALCGRNSSTCSLTCNKATFGDTAANHVRECRIGYRCAADDNTRAITVDENVNLDFACTELTGGPRLTWQTTAVHSESIQQSVQSVHNRERAAVGVPPLSWSSDLETHAATWAAHLIALGTLQHSDISVRPGEGENLWMGSAGDFDPEQMAQAWADEKKDFIDGVFPNVTRTGDWFVVGHYTQMISRRSTMLGCAIARGDKWDVLVCRYSPPGNVIGQKVY